MSERQKNFANLHKLLEENGAEYNSRGNFYYKLTAPAFIAYRQEDGLFQMKSEKEWYTYDFSEPFALEDVAQAEEYHLEGGVDALFGHIRSTFFPETVKAAV